MKREQFMLQQSGCCMHASSMLIWQDLHTCSIGEQSHDVAYDQCSGVGAHVVPKALCDLRRSLHAAGGSVSQTPRNESHTA